MFSNIDALGPIQQQPERQAIPSSDETRVKALIAKTNPKITELTDQKNELKEKLASQRSALEKMKEIATDSRLNKENLTSFAKALFFLGSVLILAGALGAIPSLGGTLALTGIGVVLILLSLIVFGKAAIDYLKEGRKQKIEIQQMEAQISSQEKEYVAIDQEIMKLSGQEPKIQPEITEPFKDYSRYKIPESIYRLEFYEWEPYQTK